MRRTGQFITGITLVIAVTGMGIVLGGCAGWDGSAPMARLVAMADPACDAPVPAIAVDTWWKGPGNEPAERPAAAPARVQTPPDDQRPPDAA